MLTSRPVICILQITSKVDEIRLHFQERKADGLKKFFALLLSVCLLLAAGASSAAGGTAADPVVTLSYLNESYLPSILTKADELIATRFDQLLDGFLDAMDERSSLAAIYAAYLHNAGYTVDATYGMGGYVCGYDDIYALALGTAVTLVSGSAEIVLASGAMVDVTDGTECVSGQPLLPGHAYLSAGERAAAVRVTSQNAELALTGGFTYLGMNPPAHATAGGAYTARYTRYADALKTMGLFLGTDHGYELDRAATRVEGVVMLIRLLGEEEAALAYTGAQPFRDVPEWASKYVAYAYGMGYTKGVSATSFAPNMEIDAAQYLTFLLRVLGYDDGAGDFLWSSAGEKAVSVGLITAAENRSFAALFYRDHVAYTSYCALSASLKDGGTTLIGKLIDAGAVTAQAYADAAF